ncbi:Nif3-like dinuclear metal center hexameric protein [Clostridium botulinum]|nr:Nif3-like dinuclear metal center hexameric protein [Clostridium botulinum]
MNLKVKNIENIIEEYAPLYLKESYDNVGLMVGNSKAMVNKILVALDCTLDVIEEAKHKGCNLIVTHHPLLFKKPSSITTDTLLGKKIIELIKNDINLYSSHTNLDSTENGFNQMVAEMLGLQELKILDISNYNEKAGIGRIGYLKEGVTLDKLCEIVKATFNISILRYSGEESLKIKKVAIINGSGQEYFSKAKDLGAECIITGDTTYHYVSDLMEEKIAVIDAGHFHTEWPALQCFYKFLKNKIGKMGFENQVLLAERNFSPYKYK